MNQAWHERSPELVGEIHADLRAKHPNLHLFIEVGGRSVVRGTFAVTSPEGRELDRYRVSIELLADYPKSLPIVRELGGRIRWKTDVHMESDGKACVLIPDDRWRCFPEGAPLKDYLDGPLRDFFLGQSLVALGGDWPFEEWSHGADGVYEYYQELLGTTDAATVRRFLYILSRLNLKTHLECPCGSGRKIRKCCQAKLAELRRKIPPAVARTAARRLGGVGSPYKGSRLR